MTQHQTTTASLIHVRLIYLHVYLCDFAKTQSPGFRLDSGEKAKPATQNLGGAPSRLAWVYSPGLDLSAGGLFGVQQSKAGGWGGGVVFY